MKRAVAISRRGMPSPNPHVGCVIVRDGEEVGRGFHEFSGGPHAEVMALKQAGRRATGATAYVTLAPCNHYGKTPPCSEALIDAGVSRVVVAIEDPNPKAGGGIDRLLTEGIEVIVGVEAERAFAANRIFLSAMALNRPYVIAKAGVSLDGRIALPTGESKWITSEAARRKAHRLRAECGVVLVGRRTVEVDDPQLTVRLHGVVNPPLRVVLDPEGKLDPTRFRVFDHEAETWHVQHQVDLHSILAKLWDRGLTGLLVEGGAKTIAEFLRADLVDEVHLFVAPKVLGAGPSWTQEFGVESLHDLAQFRFERPVRVGPDVELVAYRDRT